MNFDLTGRIALVTGLARGSVLPGVAFPRFVNGQAIDVDGGFASVV